MTDFSLDQHLKNQVLQIQTLEPEAQKLGMYMIHKNPQYREYIQELGKQAKDFDLSWNKLEDLLAPLPSKKTIWQGDYFRLLEIMSDESVAPFLKASLQRVNFKPVVKGTPYTTYRSPDSWITYIDNIIKHLTDIGNYINTPTALYDHDENSNEDKSKAVAYVLSLHLTDGYIALKQHLTNCINGKEEGVNPSLVHFQALLGSNDPECWDIVAECFLNNVTNDEVLQLVMEALAVAAPRAVKQILEIVIDKDHQLYRHRPLLFLFYKWTAFKWITLYDDQKFIGGADNIRSFIKYALPKLDTEKIRRRDKEEYDFTLTDKNSELEVLATLWATTVSNRLVAIDYIEKLMEQPSPKNKAISLYFCTLLGINWTHQEIAISQLENDNLLVVYWAVQNLKIKSLGKHKGIFDILIKTLKRMPKTDTEVSFSTLPIRFNHKDLCIVNEDTIYDLLALLIKYYPKYMDKFLPYIAQTRKRSKMRLRLINLMSKHYMGVNTSSLTNESVKKAPAELLKVIENDHLLTSATFDDNGESSKMDKSNEELIPLYKQFFDSITHVFSDKEREDTWKEIREPLEAILGEEEYHPDHFIECFFDVITGLDRDRWILMQVGYKSAEEITWQVNAIAKSNGLAEDFKWNETKDTLEGIKAFSGWLDGKGYTQVQLDGTADFRSFIVKQENVNKVLELGQQAFVELKII